MAKMKVCRESFLQLMYGWRWIHAMQAVLPGKLNGMTKAKGSVRKRILLEIAEEVLQSPDLIEENKSDAVATIEVLLSEYANTIEYGFWDNVVKWPEAEYQIGKVSTHADVPIKAYARSMAELKHAEKWDRAQVLQLIKGHNVLDIGCGLCQMLPTFVDCGVTGYTGVDRLEIYGQINVRALESTTPKSVQITLHPSDDLSELAHLCTSVMSNRFDVIWLSDVVHGKYDASNLALLQILRLALKPGGSICIVELNSQTYESTLFSTQMLVHCGVDRSLVNRKEIDRLGRKLGMERVGIVYRVSEGHDCFVLKEKEVNV